MQCGRPRHLEVPAQQDLAEATGGNGLQPQFVPSRRHPQARGKAAPSVRLAGMGGGNIETGQVATGGPHQAGHIYPHRESRGIGQEAPAAQLKVAVGQTLRDRGVQVPDRPGRSRGAETVIARIGSKCGLK